MSVGVVPTYFVILCYALSVEVLLLSVERRIRHPDRSDGEILPGDIIAAKEIINLKKDLKEEKRLRSQEKKN
jgi:hypothetical protein